MVIWPIFLRAHRGDSIELHTLQGAFSELRAFGVQGDAAQWAGTVAGCAVRLTLCVDAEAQLLFWNVELKNESTSAIRLDTVWVQDVGLASRQALLSNEAYTAHYLDESMLQDPACGPVLC